MKVCVILAFLDQVATALRISPKDASEDTLDIWTRSSTDTIFITENTQDAAHVETWISSIGGSGTSSFMTEVQGVQPSLAVNSADDQDGLKHRPFGKAQALRRFGKDRALRRLKRIVYLHGDITHAILSLNRRGWLNVQADKVRSTGNPSRRGSRGMTLEKYAQTPGDEFFQVDKHFHSFKNQCKYDVAFLDITQKTDHMPELAAFLKIPESQLNVHLKPWGFSHHIENLMVERKDYSNYTEAKYVQELLEFQNKNIHLMEQNTPEWQSHYANIPAWVFGALQEKFAGVTAEIQKLGGLHIQRATCAGS